MRKCPGILISFLLVGCAVNPTCPPVAPPSPAAKVFRYEHADWTTLPGWSADPMQEAWPAYLESCRDLRFRPVWSEACTAASAVAHEAGAAEIRAYFQQYF